MEQEIRITTRKAEEAERMQKEALEELKILCDARDAENKIFSELDRLAQELTRETNAGSYESATIEKALASFANLEALHSDIMALQLAETDSEHTEATRKLKEFFGGNDTDASEILNGWNFPEDPREGFYTITKEQWDKIPEGYKLHRRGEPRATFLCFLTPDGSGGDVLCFEGQHFQIIDTKEGKQ